MLLHPTSLPGPFGVGDLGPEAYRFADFLARAGQSWWQMLPVSPPGGGNSPYDSPSSFAGSWLLISLEELARVGWVDRLWLNHPRSLASAERALYADAIAFRMPVLRQAYSRFQEKAPGRERERFRAFVRGNADWLSDYALYVSVKQSFGGLPWTQWPKPLRTRQRASLREARRALANEIGYHEFLQYQFDRQWSMLRAYCHERGIRLLGDIPMFVKHDGADTWANQRLFNLDGAGQPRVTAGVPPDYFSRSGQLWGNPVYRWKALKRIGYAWWIAKLRRALQRFDVVRLDHFIGFHRVWQVPAGAKTAKKGRFVGVPGADFLAHAGRALGGLPFLAEDLGIVTPQVHALRDRFRLPGMRVLAFAFDSRTSDHQPHRYPRRTVVYTGTHDNDTMVGWLSARSPEKNAGAARALREAQARALRYAGGDGKEAHWALIRLALMSVADLAVTPLQDMLGLGSEGRMNIPGTPSGNWEWRVRSDQLSASLAERMAQLCADYERVPVSTSRPGRRKQRSEG